MTISELIKANQTWLSSTPVCVWVDGVISHRDCKVCCLLAEYPDAQYTVDKFGFSYVCLISNEQLGVKMIRFELAIRMLNSIFDYVTDNQIKVMIVDRCGIRTKVNLSDINSLLHFRHACVAHISFSDGYIVMTIDGKKEQGIYKNLSLHSLLQFKHPKSKVVIFDQFGFDIYSGCVEDLIRNGKDYVLNAPVMHQSGINIDILI